MIIRPSLKTSCITFYLVAAGGEGILSTKGYNFANLIVPLQVSNLCEAIDHLATTSSNKDYMEKPCVLILTSTTSSTPIVERHETVPTLGYTYHRCW